MKNRELLLFFFIIFNFISSFIYLYFIFKYRDKNIKNEKYINDLELELDKMRKSDIL